MRLILIDRHSGYIYGDYEPMRGGDWRAQAVEAARAIDHDIGERGRQYDARSSCDDCTSGYDVYRADVKGSEAIQPVLDGQDPDIIDAVERDCEYFAFVEWWSDEREED